jgi:hypothetical protein
MTLISLRMFLQTRNDAMFYIPITCEENAGMTAPIHVVTGLLIGNTSLAEVLKFAFHHHNPRLDFS